MTTLSDLLRFQDQFKRGIINQTEFKQVMSHAFNGKSIDPEVLFELKMREYAHRNRKG